MITSHVTVKGLGRDNNENTRCTLNDDNWQAAIHRHNNDDGGDDVFAKLDYNTRQGKFGIKINWTVTKSPCRPGARSRFF